MGKTDAQFVLSMYRLLYLISSQREMIRPGYVAQPGSVAGHWKQYNKVSSHFY